MDLSFPFENSFGADGGCLLSLSSSAENHLKSPDLFNHIQSNVSILIEWFLSFHSISSDVSNQPGIDSDKNPYLRNNWFISDDYFNMSINQFGSIWKWFNSDLIIFDRFMHQSAKRCNESYSFISHGIIILLNIVPLKGFWFFWIMDPFDHLERPNRIIWIFLSPLVNLEFNYVHDSNGFN